MRRPPDYQDLMLGGPGVLESWIILDGTHAGADTDRQPTDAEYRSPKGFCIDFAVDESTPTELFINTVCCFKTFVQGATPNRQNDPRRSGCTL